ncbi:hypothetical protein GJAV_G00214730 [Gymnothorax javanicus]|nr:hypothetical protein GJAV_G00214730 [Gymnothorax javanicus]
MLFLVLSVTLCGIFLHQSTGTSPLGLDRTSVEQGDHVNGVSVTSDPPQQTPIPQSLSDLIHSALLTGPTDIPTHAVSSLRDDEPPSARLSPEVLTTAVTSSAAAPGPGQMTVTSLPAEEETTTTLITTTTITTVQAPVQCNASLSGMEGMVEFADPHSSFSSVPLPLECMYSISVYRGYGVEIQLQRLNLSKDDFLSIWGQEGVGSELLANETLMSEGQVIRSSTNQVQIHYRTLRPSRHRVFNLRYRAFLLSCDFPTSPAGGSVTVTGLHPGGRAHFHCDPGSQVRGHEVATCLNSTRPRWSSLEPQCVAVRCGGWIRNASVGQILAPPPPPPGNHSSSTGGGNLSCTWVLVAQRGHRLHLHFHSFSMDQDYSRLTVRSGNSSTSPLVFDSDLDDVPERGVLSMGSSLYVDLSAEPSSIPLSLVLRYEAFNRDHCYEPFLAHGNYSSSDLTSSLGTVVSFSCSPGFVMEQGSGVIECIDPSDPHWNESEPVCRALCGGELTGPTGTVLSPDWPQSYSKGQDCVWLIHVSEDMRIELDLQILNIRENDMLTIFDGHDLMSLVIGQYLGPKERFQVVSVDSEVMIQFQSNPEDGAFLPSRGFRIQYREVERNDTCPALPPIEFGWKRSSHPSLVKGSVVTYQCEPGYDMVGHDILACQWDLTWSNSPPTCQKSLGPQKCPDPGNVPNGSAQSGLNPASPSAQSCTSPVTRVTSWRAPPRSHVRGSDTGQPPKWSEQIPKTARNRSDLDVPNDPIWIRCHLADTAQPKLSSQGILVGQPD